VTRPDSRPVAVRRAVPDDAAAIARAHVASWRAAYRGIVPDAVLDALSEERRATFWRGAIEADGAESVWVGVVGEEVVGFASAGPARDEDLGNGAGEVDAIYLVPEAWSLGIGRAMFEAAVADLRARGFDPLVLWVLSANRRGRGFYDSAGWRPDGAARMLDFDGHAIEELRYRLP
jgi:GNAT superfamily N-acetyltransferase